ncbi:ATP-dependent DNA helicase RecG [Fulvivirga sp. RKSG066]|uniref:ATP-dependent DNA helicase RecG n=1 Tax=Fulvivirga aurantia TaxID=2529383 RepID=UPI0012BCB4F9|nr:ATP-dependent DNA helicase RecG [Fulvivirga aurantia]MTI22137.1 ATP-dependent DNA helicase RecG [Fulvivirga aurantia]
MLGFFETKIEFLKGVGPQKAALLQKELDIHTYGDLLQHYPFRYEDRTKFYPINELHGNMPNVQIKGRIRKTEMVGAARKRRLVAHLHDETGELELVWFKGAQWILKKLQPGVEYIVFGKPQLFGGKINMAHPEIEILSQFNPKSSYLQPVYHTTETLRKRYLDSKGISKLQKTLLHLANSKIHETLTPKLIEDYRLINKAEALKHIHFPTNHEWLQKAQFRLKFEELFYIQLRLLKLKLTRVDKFRGKVLDNPDLLSRFYNDHLPFDLTNAQKRVIKEIYRDMKSGKQMNRLLQGDVGSGKTIVAFICMLAAIGSGAQATLMAPTEILAVQHYHGLKEFADKMGVTIALLTGSTKKSERKVIHQYLRSGDLKIIVGTHALLEDVVQFSNLGLAIVDEQHRFGVAQRSKLWQKDKNIYPHVLVMTATPIPRTLAMTMYGDLDISTIDELPAGRKPIKTVHRYDSNRLKVNGFIKEQIAEGRQIYIVYPLIEESEKLDLKHLEDGYESICRAFPNVPVSIVHGRMKAEDKDFEMQRFVKGETKIMVATTVIEVGVNVPNASVMIIENAERFGLAQLHQLRGRVGRGAEQSYCILISNYKLSKEGKTRLETMVRTNNGFEIADVDLKLRGPGDITGTQQSGILDLLIADLGKDGKILQMARQAASALLEKDGNLDNPENGNIKRQIESLRKTVVNWSRIS